MTEKKEKKAVNEEKVGRDNIARRRFTNPMEV